MFDIPTSTHKLTQSQLLSVWQNACQYKQPIRKQKRPYASHAMCQRRMALHGMLPEVWTEMSGSLPFYADIGKAVEKITLQKYKKAGVLAGSSFKLPEELFEGYFNIGGEIDAFIQVNDVLGVFDIKTTGVVEASEYIELTAQMKDYLAEHAGIIIIEDELNHELIQSDELPILAPKFKTNSAKKPYRSYLNQVQMYCAVTGVDDGWLQFISRRVQDTFDLTDTSPSTSFYAVPIDDDALISVVAKVIYASRCRDAEVIPEVPLGIRKSDCKNAFCPFYSVCHEGVDLFNLHNYGGFRETQSLKEVTVEQKLEWKQEALDNAKKYIAGRASRANITRELLKAKRK